MDRASHIGWTEKVIYLEFIKFRLDEIKKNNGKRFSEIEEVPSDKAKEILESIKKFK